MREKSSNAGVGKEKKILRKRHSDNRKVFRLCRQTLIKAHVCSHVCIKKEILKEKQTDSYQLAAAV